MKFAFKKKYSNCHCHPILAFKIPKIIHSQRRVVIFVLV